MADDSDPDILTLTTKIISAHVGHNHVGADALPELIQLVYRSLAMAGNNETEPTPLTPAVPIGKSVHSDYIVCLEDGKKLKMLKRYLQTSYGMTPEQYRQKWGLPASYPMVAPSYAGHRSSLAKKIGLGRKPTESGQTSLEEAVESDLPTEPQVTRVRARRARGSKG